MKAIKLEKFSMNGYSTDQTISFSSINESISSYNNDIISNSSSSTSVSSISSSLSSTSSIDWSYKIPATSSTNSKRSRKRSRTANKRIKPVQVSELGSVDRRRDPRRYHTLYIRNLLLASHDLLPQDRLETMAETIESKVFELCQDTSGYNSIYNNSIREIELTLRNMETPMNEFDSLLERISSEVIKVHQISDALRNVLPTSNSVEIQGFVDHFLVKVYLSSILKDFSSKLKFKDLVFFTVCLFLLKIDSF
jgi:hypothetical protein